MINKISKPTHFCGSANTLIELHGSKSVGGRTDYLHTTITISQLGPAIFKEELLDILHTVILFQLGPICNYVYIPYLWDSSRMGYIQSWLGDTQAVAS